LLELSDSQKQEIKSGINQLDSGQRISLEDFFIKTSQKTQSYFQYPKVVSNLTNFPNYFTSKKRYIIFLGLPPFSKGGLGDLDANI
jgi:hypothetical protein